MSEIRVKILADGLEHGRYDTEDRMDPTVTLMVQVMMKPPWYSKGSISPTSRLSPRSFFLFYPAELKESKFHLYIVCDRSIYSLQEYKSSLPSRFLLSYDTSCDCWPVSTVHYPEWLSSIRFLWIHQKQRNLTCKRNVYVVRITQAGKDRLLRCHIRYLNERVQIHSLILII